MTKIIAQRVHDLGLSLKHITDLTKQKEISDARSRLQKKRPLT